MRILRTYWKTLTQSASNPSYYRDVLSTPLRFSVLFFVCSIFLLSIFAPLVWRIQEFPALLTATSQEIDSISEQVPKESGFLYMQGKLQTTGINKPFVIQATKKFQDLGVSRNLFAILEDGSETVAAINFYSDRVVMQEYDSTGNQEVFYSDLRNKDFELEFTGQNLRDNKGDFLAAFEKFITVGLVVMIPVIFCVLLLTNLFTLLIFSIVVQVLFWIAGIKIKYKKAFQIGLHAIVVALFVEELSKLLFGRTDLSLVTPAFFGILILVVWEIRRQKGSLYG